MAILVPVVIAGAFLARDWLYPIFCLILFALLLEWSYLARIKNPWYSRIYAGAGVVIALCFRIPAIPYAVTEYVIGSAAVLWCFGVICVVFFKTLRGLIGKKWFLLTFGFVVSLAAILSFFNTGNSGWALIAMMGVVAFTDTFAYLVGNFLGQNKLHTEVSPNKTWEGTVAGIVAGCLCLVFVDQMGWFPLNSYWLIPVLIGFTIYGDLFESAVKRVANIKDSGNVLPGHGGFLDRLDSILAFTPFAYFSTNFNG